MTTQPTTFAALGVPAKVIEAMIPMGVTAPFPIQTATLKDGMAGKDLLGRGKTGSGKTIAFAIPTVVALSRSTRRRTPGAPRALILVPTRELANQVAATTAPLAAALGLRLTTVYGGVGFGNQIAAMRNGVDIVVACPGRLEDLIGQGHCRLDAIEVTVLDEADHMADMGFLPGVKRLLDRTPVGGQRMLFSATLDNGVDVLVKRYLVNPVTHAVDAVDAPSVQMTHHVVTVSAADKVAVATRLAAGHDKVLLFTRTKHGAKRLVKQLGTAGVRAVELHGNLSQSARERNLEAFSNGGTSVLVATDIAARGIHVDDVALVVHFDPPAEHKAFLHRSGRTARAGAEGVVVTVITPDQAKDVRALARAAGITPTVTDVHPTHPLLGELAGPQAPKVAVRYDAPEESFHASAAGRAQHSRNGGGGRNQSTRGANGGRDGSRSQQPGRPAAVKVGPSGNALSPRPAGGANRSRRRPNGAPSAARSGGRPGNSRSR